MFLIFTGFIGFGALIYYFLIKRTDSHQDRLIGIALLASLAIIVFLIASGFTVTETTSSIEPYPSNKLPQYTPIVTMNGTFHVIDSTGKIVARVGDKIKVGGGADETQDGRVARGYSAQLPSERCSGPYYIVGEVITVDKSTSPVTATPTLKSAPVQHFPSQAFDEAAGNLTKNWDTFLQ